MNIKCNICGGDVSLSADKTFATCEYCGSTITVPKVSDEQRAAAFNRGNHFRRIGEFDKALASYERILRDDDTDAEAHWCAALCRFGIEYVEDPATYEWIPTCHRASFDSFTEDVDFKAALEYSDGLTRRLYQKEAAKIAEVQKGILATSQNEEPYDVFICYKETGEDGQRTKDSILAQDIYYQLTDQGHRVFFSRITLEDKAGSEYEPYIFAALNSAKVMVAVGTKPEHFSAVWVRNEWSRFLALMRKDRSRVLLPCYRDMDPYDLPEQLAVLQSYDMGKIGFIQDLIHGVDKVVRAEKKPAVTETVVVQQSGATNVTALVKRGYMALEDGEWEKADDFFEQALNQDAELAEAYLGKFLAENKATTLDNFAAQELNRTAEARPQELEACPKDVETVDNAIAQCMIPGLLDKWDILKAFDDFDRTFTSIAESRQLQLNWQTQKLDQDKNLNRSVQFGDPKTKAQVKSLRDHILNTMAQRLQEALTEDATNAERISKEYAQFVQKVFNTVLVESHSRIEKRRKQEEEHHEEQMGIIYEQAERWIYRASIAKTSSNKKSCLESAIEKLTELGDYRDARERLAQCQQQLTAVNRSPSGVCRHCGGKFGGLIIKKCVKCGRPKDY